MARQCGSWNEQKEGQEKRTHNENPQAIKSEAKMTRLLNELLAALARRDRIVRRFMVGA
jgi:hypothetical protein